MQLRGQHGYAMAALLVGMSVAAVLMTAVMPAWKQMSKREREAELVFRGQQYVRAIGLFQKRSGPGVLPPNIDVLVTGRFLRKKFKDPITNQEFDLLSPTQAAGQAGAAQQSGAQQSGGGAQPSGTGRGFQAPASGQGRVIGAQGGAAGAGATGGVIGVASKSKEESLRIFNGRTHYNEWQFIYVQQASPGQGGAGGPGRGGAGGPGAGRGTQPPQPGSGIGGGFGGGRGSQGRGSGPFGPQGGGQPPQQPGPFVPPRPR